MGLSRVRPKQAVGDSAKKWPNVNVVRWTAIQAGLRQRIKRTRLADMPRFVAGVDCAFSADDRHIYAAAVVYDVEAGEAVEQVTLKRKLTQPYIPGYLSFREGPAVRAALRKLTTPFDAVMFDGQGYAHPRRCGLACHVGVQMDIVAIGAAKSLLIGTHDPLPEPAGSSVDLVHDGESVGAVLRTRDNVNPIYISVGHRIDLPSACALALACCKGVRIPEPTRLADRLVARAKQGK